MSVANHQEIYMDQQTTCLSHICGVEKNSAEAGLNRNVNRQDAVLPVMHGIQHAQGYSAPSIKSGEQRELNLCFQSHSLTLQLPNLYPPRGSLYAVF